MFGALIKLIGQKVFFPLFLLLNVLVCAPVLWPLIWIAKQFENGPWKVIGWPFLFLAIAFLWAPFSAALAMTRYMFDGRLFLDSFRSAWRDVWFAAQTLPLIGHWFERKRDPREALDDDEPGERPPPVE